MGDAPAEEREFCMGEKAFLAWIEHVAFRGASAWKSSSCFAFWLSIDCTLVPANAE